MRGGDKRAGRITGPTPAHRGWLRSHIGPNPQGWCPPRHIMLCPQCGWIRNKKAWRPSQWAAENAVTDDYRQCKVCDGEQEHEQTWYRRPEEATKKAAPKQGASPDPSARRCRTGGLRAAGLGVTLRLTCLWGRHPPMNGPS